jgi:glycosyltransferase involved in cell wall biosynthesis
MEVYGIPSNKISVIYLGYDQHVFSTNTKRRDPGDLPCHLGVKRPYLLHHGVIQPRKNLQRLIMAFDLLLKTYPDLDLDLVLAGPIGWRSEEIVAAATRLRGRVILTGPVAQEDLVGLIRSAVLCVIPSLYEGFCLPLLECMACGVPTIAARSSCLPEISGDVLRYFDPLSIEDTAAAIHAGICDDELRRDLAARGLGRAQQFSWSRCAEETLDVLAEVAGFSNKARNSTLASSLAV